MNRMLEQAERFMREVLQKELSGVKTADLEKTVQSFT